MFIGGNWESKDYTALTRRKRHDLSDCRASMVRPCMELQGFARVELKAGETKTVSFRVRADQMAFLDRDRRWKVEAGRIQVLLGSSSEDIRLEGSF